MADYRYLDGAAQLGPRYAGQAGTIGYRLVDDAGSVVQAFTTANVVETAPPGTYEVVAAGLHGLPVPEGFSGSVTWGTAGADLASERIWPGKFEYIDRAISEPVTLAPTGLDAITTTAPAGVAANFREMVVALWRRQFKKSTLTTTQLKTYADNGLSVLTTQPVSDNGSVQTLDAAT